MARSDQPKISLVIPVYNAEKTLTECLASVIDQTYGNYEIIVVDNASTDGTAEIIRNFQKKSPRIVSVFEGRRGRGSARNAGVRRAAGEIIAMTDSDCVAPPNWLSEIVRPIVEESESVVMGFEEDAVGNYWTRYRQKDDLAHCAAKTSDGYIEHLDTRNFAVKADLIKAVMFDPAIATCEDFDFFLRLRTRSSSRIRFVPFVRIKHYHDASAKELFMTQYSRAFAVEKILEAHRQDPEIRRYLADNEIESGLTAKGFLLFPFWIARQIVFSPIRATYAIIAESAWKFGVLAAALRPGRPA